MEPSIHQPKAPADDSPAVIDDHGDPAALQGLLLQWALYLSRFDPLAVAAADFEQER